EQALHDLEAISAKDAESSQADMALITAHIRRKEFDQALAAVDTLQKKQPASPIPPNIRGTVYLARRDLKNARASFEKALEAQPGYFPAAYNRSLVDLQEGKPQAARARYEQILAKDPKNEQVLLAQAELLALSGARPAEVGAMIDKAIAGNPTSPRPRLILV